MDKYDIKDSKQAEGGRRRIVWAEREMPVLRTIMERFPRTQTMRVRTTERYRAIVFSTQETLVRSEPRIASTERLASVVTALQKLG